MSATYNDGTVQYGARTWVVHHYPESVETARGTYDCDNISINRPTKSIDRTNQLGEPTGSVGIADFVTGTATFQLASSSTAEPRNGDKIICDGEAGHNANIDSGIGDETFYITSVSRAESKDAEKKFNVSFKKAYGG